MVQIDYSKVTLKVSLSSKTKIKILFTFFYSQKYFRDLK